MFKSWQKKTLVPNLENNKQYVFIKKTFISCFFCEMFVDFWTTLNEWVIHVVFLQKSTNISQIILAIEVYNQKLAHFAGLCQEAKKLRTPVKWSSEGRECLGPTNT